MTRYLVARLHDTLSLTEAPSTATAHDEFTSLCVLFSRTIRLATVLTPITNEYLQVAAQCGVNDIVHRYPGADSGILKAAQHRIASFGLRLGVVEGYLPIEAIKLGQDDGTELAQLGELIRRMGDLGIPLLCYNFMSGTDWVRTRTDVSERGSALVSAFRLADAEKAILLGRQSSSESAIPSNLTAAKLWTNLERLLNQLVPIAEQCGVTLAMHPDDPPLEEMFGRPRIMHELRGELRTSCTSGTKPPKCDLLLPRDVCRHGS